MDFNQMTNRKWNRQEPTGEDQIERRVKTAALRTAAHCHSVSGTSVSRRVVCANRGNNAKRRRDYVG